MLGTVLRRGWRVVMAATLGVLIFATTAAIAAHGVGYRLVIITTGSMAPEIPVDSVALASPTAAGEIAVDDVIVMTRDDGLRVTHRVVAISGSGPGAEVVTKGDANDVADVTTYRLSETALRVETVVPAFGGVLDYLASRPGRLGVVAIAVSLLAGLALRQLWAPPRSVEVTRRPSLL